MSQTTLNTSDSMATLIDTTRCVGCRSCQVTCKQWNGLQGQKTSLPGEGLGLQSPRALGAETFVVLTYAELPDARAPGGLRYVSTKRQCMHCDDPACASACPVTALHKDASGAVTYDADKCLGCRYCMWACPWGVPTAEWSSMAPRIRKCTHCADRAAQPAPSERNGKPLSDEEKTRFVAAQAIPACVKQCPANALKFGKKADLLQEAHARIARHPDRYVDHVYGEREAGGTSMLYLAAVPFRELGLPAVGMASYPARSTVALGAVPGAVIGVGAALGGVYALQKRKEEVRRAEATAGASGDGSASAGGAAAEDHHEFAPVPGKLWTPANLALLAMMALGWVSFVARFALGLGGATNLSDTWAWGLWIVFDLVWIAVAAGAFAMAGLIYVFQRKDLYSVGRASVLMGLLSYSFVTVTLLADLGLPWHFYQLALQAPKHSAMFEVSWCVGLYVTVLAFEFFPVPFERFGMKRALDAWRTWSPVYVALAVPTFVWLMSRSLAYTGAALAVFALLAFAFRPRAGQKPVPVMLAIAAVTLSTMHQSSLGSLFLLMPDKLSPLWWSPVMPVAFFLSSIAAGTALMVLVELWIARAFGRALRVPQLASMGKVAFWALLAYLALRLGDMVLRGQLGLAFGGPKGGLFLAEIVLGGILPLALLSSARVRETPRLLGLGAFLSVAGVVFNRVNVVVFGMDLKGALPQLGPQPYLPSLVEWGVSLGLIAATIFLFGLGVRKLPVLPKEEAGR
jgi:formate dehydrogenase iron-sulfur subunit